MKKLITLILILALALPAVAMADDVDPIVGGWYLFYDNTKYPEMSSNFGNYDYVFSVYFFSQDGTVYLLESDIKDGTSTPVFMSAGSWKKTEGLRRYAYKLIGFGEGIIQLKESGEMYLSAQDQSVYLHMRWVSPFNPYQDFVFGEVTP